MESNKQHIRHCLLFCFHQKKSAVDIQNYLVFGKNAIRTCANRFKRFKNGDIGQKERLVAIEKDELQKDEKKS